MKDTKNATTAIAVNTSNGLETFEQLEINLYLKLSDLEGKVFGIRKNTAISVNGDYGVYVDLPAIVQNDSGNYTEETLRLSLEDANGKSDYTRNKIFEESQFRNIGFFTVVKSGKYYKITSAQPQKIAVPF